MSKKRLSKHQAVVAMLPAPKRAKNSRARLLLRAILLVVAMSAAVLSWGYRLFDVGEIIGHGGLGDFSAYFEASRALISGKVIWAIGKPAPFGPPFTLIPFLPFVFLPKVAAQIGFSFINAVAYVLTWYVLGKQCLRRFSFAHIPWWFGLALLPWSFPVAYSLGSGNPMGIVTWGVYASLLMHSLTASLAVSAAVLLKVFPLVLVPLAGGKKQERLWQRVMLLGVVIGVAGISLLVWTDQWVAFGAYALHLINISGNSVDSAAQNQSFTSSITRIGMSTSWLRVITIMWNLGVMGFAAAWFNQEQPWKKMPQAKRLTWGMRLLALTLLVHPMPWQYYYALFVPYLFLMLIHKRFAYLPVLVLLSFNSGWLQGGMAVNAFANSSQFLATLLFMSIEFVSSKRTSIDQIIKESSFFKATPSR